MGFQKLRSRKILVGFYGSCSLIFLAVMCVSQSRFFHETVSESQFLQGYVEVSVKVAICLFVPIIKL